MLAHTHSLVAPWAVVRADDKAAARLGIIADIIARLAGPEAVEILPDLVFDPAVVFPYDPVAAASGWLAK